KPGEAIENALPIVSMLECDKCPPRQPWQTRRKPRERCVCQGIENARSLGFADERECVIPACNVHTGRQTVPAELARVDLLPLDVVAGAECAFATVLQSRDPRTYWLEFVAELPRLRAAEAQSQWKLQSVDCSFALCGKDRCTCQELAVRPKSLDLYH